MTRRRTVESGGRGVPRKALSRRAMLRRVAVGSAALAGLPAAVGLLGPRARAEITTHAQRVVFFYFPDGVVGPSQNGDPSQWHVQGTGTGFSLPNQLQPLSAFKDECVFLNGLTMGPTDSGSHPGGAKKLLTGVDGGYGQSLDQFLAHGVGASMPHRLVYLGAQANVNGASGDKHLSYPSAGQTTAPIDDPMAAFSLYFGGTLPVGDAPSGGPPKALTRRLRVLDTAYQDLAGLRGRMGTADKAKLDVHLTAFEEVEAQLEALVAQSTAGAGVPPSCEDPQLDTLGLTSDLLYDPAWYPTILKLQTDIMVQAMACGLTRVGVLQNSHHTSELIMSRFEGTEMYDPGFDMRSHQASHYGPAHDESKLEFASFRQQRRWFVEQFAYLLEALASRPEGDGTMLDNTLCVLMTEVSDGNTHSHDAMPFVLAGKAGGALETGRVLDYPWTRHSNLLVSIARAMGADIWNFGQASSGPLGGLLSP